MAWQTKFLPVLVYFIYIYLVLTTCDLPLDIIIQKGFLLDRRLYHAPEHTMSHQYICSIFLMTFFSAFSSEPLIKLKTLVVLQFKITVNNIF